MSDDVTKNERSTPDNEIQASDPNDWIFLTKVSNEIEYEMVTALLKEAEIPTVSKVGDVEGFLKVITGVPFGGMDVMVPRDRFEEANAIISAPVDENELMKEELETER